MKPRVHAISLVLPPRSPRTRETLHNARAFRLDKLLRSKSEFRVTPVPLTRRGPETRFLLFRGPPHEFPRVYRPVRQSCCPGRSAHRFLTGPSRVHIKSILLASS